MKIKVRNGKLHQLPWLHQRKSCVVSKPKLDINKASSQALINHLGIKPEVAEQIEHLRDGTPFVNVDDLVRRIKNVAAKKRLLADSLVFYAPDQVEISLVRIEQERLFSNKPYAFQINFVVPAGAEVSMASVDVHWKGIPFTIQQLVTSEESRAGSVLLKAETEHALPPGPVEIDVTLYDSLGGAAKYHLQEWVYPSNPFSFFLSPGNRSIYNGSVRPDWEGGNWVTRLNITLLNGDNQTVPMQRNVTWKFWDGGVGGSLIEEGNFNWGEQINVPPFGQYGGWISFTSPPGSSIFKKYEDLEDMTIEIIFRKSNGTAVISTITCRIMAGWGINIIMVGDYNNTEQNTIAQGIEDARSVYENVGLTFSSVQWWSIANADAGGYTVLNDHDEWEDLLDDWTVPNNSVDCFVVRGLWDSFAGWSPIPGPDDKDDSCEDDGLAVSNGLGCFAHELGHFMGGLNHANSEGRGNVMHSICGGRQFTYNQYENFFDHNWTRVVR